MRQIPEEDNTKKNACLNQLSECIPKKVRVNGLDLREVHLVGAELSKLEADQLDLSSANLQGAKFLEVRLGNCNFTQVILNDTIWSNATVRMCLFDGMQGLKACFDWARIEDSSMKGVNLSEASFNGAKLTETTFERSTIQGCIFDNAEGDGVSFRGADLCHPSLNAARFNDADFRGADLRGANLSKGYFRDADFRGALLDGTLFEGADLHGAIFDVGAEPYATSTDSTNKESRETDELANTVVTLLGDSLTELPNIFADNKDLIEDITDRLQQASSTFKATAKHSPEEWKQWTESFLALAKDEQAIDLETIIKALYEGPIELQNLLTLNEVSKDDMLDRIQHLSEMLNSAAAEPPDEWKPILEPLIKKTTAGEAIDFKTVIGLLSDWSRVLPPR
jgi:uncharacterized protein YjbI with pentapeptide repeats